jgi:hypothetical protein
MFFAPFLWWVFIFNFFVSCFAIFLWLYGFCSSYLLGFLFLGIVQLKKLYLALNLNAYFDFLLLPEISLFILVLESHTHTIWALILFFFFGCCRTRAGYSRGDQFYAAYPVGTELLTDATKVCDQ